MRKEYTTPVINIEEVKLLDVINASGKFGDVDFGLPGNKELDWGDFFGK